MIKYIKINIAFKLTLLSAFLLLMSAQLSAQARFTASSDAKQIILGNQFEVYFTIKNGKGTNFKPPRFLHFNVLSGPSQSSTTSITNGRVSSEKNYSYIVQPKRLGKYTIEAATIIVDGKKMKSNTLMIEVLKGKKNATTQAELDADIDKQVFVDIIPNVEQGRIGQQVVLDYKLFTTVGIENYNLLSESDYQGFFTKDMRQYDSKLKKEVIDGIQYTTKVIKRIAIFPQQAGLINIEPARIQVGISLEDPNNKRRRSIFYTPRVKMHNLTTNKGENVKIEVKPLPSNAPPTFTGAVGKFKITPLIGKNKVSTDDALTIRLSINGNGDVKQVQAPPLILPEDLFEVYEPRIIQEESFESKGQLEARKLVEYLVLPKKPGSYEITPAFTYFDTDSLDYVTLAPKKYQIYVTKGTNVKTGKIPQADTEIANTDIKFIELDTSFSSGKRTFFGSGLFWIFWILPLLGLLGTIVYKQIQSSKGPIDLALLKRNRAEKKAQEKLEMAKKYMQEGNSRSFYDEISRASLGYVCDKLNISISQLTKDNVKSQLHSLKVSPQHIDKFMEILKTSEMALFAGMDNSDAMQTTYQNAIEVITNIEEEIGLQ